ncbi:hypothetical protein TrST_g6788 [Triparma strigata]|uniref:peptidylprolyl isomerase n=1 Tax=Triparma strigata TaxID=1606541 RepID=A0A9W7C071_9STRA|nr:hypothetical protein TrST_g6788 [Triparma strigata]
MSAPLPVPPAPPPKPTTMPPPLPKSKPANAAHTKFWARACYDFISSEEGDLTFRDGDIIRIEEVSSRNWWIASHMVGTRGAIPSNFVQVLPQYGSATITCSSHISTLSVTPHLSSGAALNVRFTKEGEDKEEQDLVKTVAQVSQFIRELSRTFPEAGLPLEVELGSDWHSLLLAIHSFNILKSAETASVLLNSLVAFETLNGMTYAWLVPSAADKPKVTPASRIISVNRSALGTEAIVLHDWEGNHANGELCGLKVGDHVIVVHEQSDWVYCRRSPESEESGYVPLMYLRKITSRDADWQSSPPPLPPHLKTNRTNSMSEDDHTAFEPTPSDYIATKSGSVSGQGSGENVDFTLQTVTAFDELINSGLTVEVTKEGESSPIVTGDFVTMTIDALKWIPSTAHVKSFATGNLSFTCGVGEVSQALDLGVQRLMKGDCASIVGSPEMCYGDVGIPGLVSSKCYVVYKVEVLEVTKEKGISSGPECLITRVAKAHEVGEVGEERERMSLPKGTQRMGSTLIDSSENSENVDMSNPRLSTTVSDVRDSLSTSELVERVKSEGLIIGLNGEGATVLTEEGRKSRASSSAIPVPTPPPSPPPTRPLDTSVSSVPSSIPSPSPLPPNSTLDHLQTPSILIATTPPSTTNWGAEGIPTSPSDNIMSPVSMALAKGHRRKTSGGNPLANQMERRPSGEREKRLSGGGIGSSGSGLTGGGEKRRGSKEKGEEKVEQPMMPSL